jgi:hypothetical protein
MQPQQNPHLSDVPAVIAKLTVNETIPCLLIAGFERVPDDFFQRHPASFAICLFEALRAEVRPRACDVTVAELALMPSKGHAYVFAQRFSLAP